jgi:hypothetical protein
MSLALKQQIATLLEKKQTAAVKKQIKALQDQVDAINAAAASVVAEQERIAEVQATKEAKKYGGAAAGAEVAADAPEPGRTLSCKNCPSTFFFSDSEAAYYAKWEMVDPVRCAPCRAAKKAAQPQPLEIECNDCGDHFLHSVGAQKHYEMSGFDAPIRCTECRAHKKANKVPVNPPLTHIKCGDCSKNFEFLKSQRVHFEAQGWAPPTRCLPCRTAKKTAPKSQAAQIIGCGDCKKDFSFPVASQKHFKAQGWAAPTRCGDCRQAKKAKIAAEVKAKPKAKEEMSETAKDQAAELAALDAAEAMDASKASSAAKMASNIGNVADLLDAALASVGLPTGIVLRPSDSDEKGASV